MPLWVDAAAKYSGFFCPLLAGIRYPFSVQLRPELRLTCILLSKEHLHQGLQEYVAHLSENTTNISTTATASK
jgi:hypothetical protein